MGAEGARHSGGTKGEGNFCSLCSPMPSSNPTLTLTPTPALSLVLTLPLPLPLPLIKTEYWDRAGGGGNISYAW